MRSPRPNDDRRGRELANRDVIGVAVSAFRAERHDDIRTDSSEVRAIRSIASRGLARSSCRPDTRARKLTDAEQRGRRAELRSRIVRAPQPRVLRIAAHAAISTAFTLSRGDEKRLDAIRRVLRQAPPNPRDSSSGCASTAISRRLLAIVSTAHRGNALQLLSNAA